MGGGGSRGGAGRVGGGRGGYGTVARDPTGHAPG